MVSAKKIKDYIQETAAINQEGSTNILYKQGLQMYEGKCYTQAISKFEQVKQLFPQHSEVDKLIKQSRQAITNGKEQSSLFCGFNSNLAIPMWVFGVLGAGIFLFIVILFINRAKVNYL